MTTIVTFPKKSNPRGPRGRILIRKGQTWIQIHSRRQFVIRDIINHKGKVRVLFSEKRKHNACLENLSEQTFRSSYMILDEYIVFENELYEKLSSMSENPRQKRLQLVQEEKKPRIVPRKNSEWKNEKGYILTVTKLYREKGEKLWLAVDFKSGGFGVMEYDSHRWHNQYTQVS